MRHKRLILLALSLVVLTAPAIMATRFIIGQSDRQSKPLIMKVLRGKDHWKNKPTRQEIASARMEQEAERQFEDSIPKHVPLKIKIRKEKEKEFKDLRNKRWARDFELEVTNTGVKPIYSLSLLLVTDVKAAAGFRIVAPLDYGRVELGDIRVKAEHDDIPIKPGESQVFKIHPGQLEAWDLVWPEERRPYPKKIQIVFQTLSFGDGTGYAGSDGLALPRNPNQRSSLGPCPNHAPKALPDLLAWHIPPERDSIPLSRNLPATFLPVNFFSEPAKTVSGSLISLSQDCCPGFGCTSLIPNQEIACVNCPLQQRPIITSCSDPNGVCLSAEMNDYTECPLANGKTFPCQRITLTSCGGAPTPTQSPSPTPSPSPSPSPTPIPCPFTAASNCAGGVPRDYCLNPNPPGLGLDTGGCPLLLRAEGNCCVPIPCPSPTPAPPPCEGTLIFNPSPACSWTCASLSGGGGGGGGNIHIVDGDVYECTTYYWVLYHCFPINETGETDWNCSEVDRWYAGCW